MSATATQPSKPKIRTGDTVKALAGIDRGKKGKVLQVLPKDRLAVVEGLNVRSKNVRSKRQGQKGEVVKYNAPIALDNLSLICPACGKTTRVGYTILDGKKLRICKRCHEPITK